MINLNTLAIDGFDGKNLNENVFESLTNLKNITLSGINFNDIPENIFARNLKLESFEWLIDKCRNCTLNPKRFLKGLENLKTFKIHKNPLTQGLLLHEDFFSDCKKLIVIEINHSKLKTLPENLFQKIENLERLDLSFNNILNLPQKLLHSVRKLKVLKLNNNKINELSNKNFEKLTSLTNLDLSRNSIVSIEQLTFASLHSITELDLSHNKLEFTDETMPEWKSLKKLQTLDMSYNTIHLSGIPHEFRSTMISLKSLKLNHNYIGPDIDFEVDLKFISHDIEVDLSYNRIQYVHFKQMLPYSLRTKAKVDLSENPLKCDCHNVALALKLRNSLRIPWINFSPSRLFCDNYVSLQETPISSMICPVQKCPTNCECYHIPLDLSTHEELLKCDHVPSEIPENQYVTLDLSSTNLTKITSVPQNVQKLILSNNKLTGLSFNTSHLAEIELDGNALTEINVKNLVGLSSMKLGRNPYGCDCRSKSFITFVRQNSEKIKDISNITLDCKTPISALKVEVKDFCTEETYLWTISIPLLVILLLLVWRKEEIKMFLYAIPFVRHNCFSQEASIDAYDVFISYANDDSKYVEETLVPTLENQDFKCLIHVRDFLPGLTITENVAKAIESSTIMLIVLSKYFLQSSWGQHE